MFVQTHHLNTAKIMPKKLLRDKKGERARFGVKFKQYQDVLKY
jgi:hypothetical protein